VGRLCDKFVDELWGKWNNGVDAGRGCRCSEPCTGSVVEGVKESRVFIVILAKVDSPNVISR
jgi:hypothetical protein